MTDKNDAAKSIGLFGGTFSPPHEGHVRAARLFIDAMGLDRLIVMPAGFPPHKPLPDGAADGDRLEMARRAFGAFAEVSDWEIKRGGKSYTVDTLRMLREKYPEDRLYMLIGEDMLESFGSWRSPAEIAKLAGVCYMRRNASGRLCAAEDEFERICGCRPVFIGAEPLVVSSTEIREKLNAGQKPDALATSVYEYIKENGLYHDRNNGENARGAERES